MHHPLVGDLTLAFEMLELPADPGLSVDEFLYARCVVVANGRQFFDAVLAEPKQMPKDMEFESLLYVARTALKKKTGRDDAEPDEPAVSYETFSNRAGWAYTLVIRPRRYRACHGSTRRLLPGA